MAAKKAAAKGVAFYPPFTTANPKAEIRARVTKAGRGTVNVVAEDGNGTPYADVPVIAPGDPHPANGPFVVGPVAGSGVLKRKLPPPKKAKKS